MAEAVLHAAGFGYRYPERAQPSLEDIDLELAGASFTVLAGRSASSKSTLLRAASGLVPHFHGGEAWGELTVGGLSVRDHEPGDIAQVAGTVLQEPEAQLVMNSVGSEIALALEHRGAAPGAVARAVEEVALALGVEGLLERRLDTLSGGELQRVALAAALAHRPELLILDEPTSQLDPVAGDELIWLLRRLNEEWGTAVLMAEHRLERCLPAADRVVAMDDGRIVFNGTPADFLDWSLESDPALATPAASLFGKAHLRPLPVSVKAARDALGSVGLVSQRGGVTSLPAADGRADADPVHAAAEPAPGNGGWRARLRKHGDSRPASSLRVSGLWYEIADGPAILRDLDLALYPGETVALMGRNGAGKSTLLRLAKGLIEPTRGRIERDGDVALLMQNPGDYLVHEHASDEVSEHGLAEAGLASRAHAHPRDLSGGERQRLALEVVLDGVEPAVVCLDEPTRGMDRAHKNALAARLEALAAGGAAVVVATHDTEFAARFAQRVVLMGQGVVIADASTREVLSGGWQFATDTARILGESSGALTPEQGAELLQGELVR
ncbi:MAG TPA: ATP-binding cassette domain-containing protein [Thermoleophilaceae bacterium]|nr:ATP-binding cassette domain-containing protein [Thermoleophilaceae bacterium]